MSTMHSPEVQFWGMVVHAGKPAKISLENEDGLMEMFHLTNVALKDTQGSKPCQVKIRPPHDKQEFILGTLVPGSVYQFQTDLLLQPDTVFMHTGTGDVHLTGYKSITIEDDDDEDLDDDDDDDEDDDEDEEDDDFVVNGKDGEDDEGSGGSDSEDGSEDMDDDEEETKAAHMGRKAKLSQQLQQRASATRRLQPEPESSDGDMGSSEGDPDESDDNAEDEEEEEPDVAAAVKRAQRAAEKFKKEKEHQRAGPAAAEAEDEFDLNEDDEDVDDDEDGDEEDEEDEEEEEAPAMKAAATPQAGSKKRDAQASATLTPQPAKKPKVVDDKPKTAPPAAGTVKLGKDGHPDVAKLNDATKQYANAVRDFLKSQPDNAMKMSVLGTKLQRPKDAGKIGELLKHYPHWFFRSGQKGQELIKLTKGGRS